MINTAAAATTTTTTTTNTAAAANHFGNCDHTSESTDVKVEDFYGGK